MAEISTDTQGLCLDFLGHPAGDGTQRYGDA